MLLAWWSVIPIITITITLLSLPSGVLCKQVKELTEAKNVHGRGRGNSLYSRGFIDFFLLHHTLQC